MAVEGMEFGPLGWSDWAMSLSVGIGTAVGTAIALAFFLRWLFARSPRAYYAASLLPWRAAVILAMLWLTPDALLAVLSDGHGTWDEILRSLVVSQGVEFLQFFCIIARVSILAAVLTAATLVRYWVTDSLPNILAAAVRTFAVVAAGVWVDAQMRGTGGFGGDFIRLYYEYNFDAAAAAWLRIVYTALTVDLLLGAMQLAIRLYIGRTSTEPHL